MEWEFLTKSGSLYRVQHRRDDTWWVTADNVPNPYSDRWPDGHWIQIHAPEQSTWPPALDTRLSLYSLVPDPRTAMRSGHLLTSRVQAVAEVAIDG